MSTNGNGRGRTAEANQPRRWTDDEVERLKELASRNTPTRVMGITLGRSEKSIRGKAAQEGIPLKPVNQSPYGRRR